MSSKKVSKPLAEFIEARGNMGKTGKFKMAPILGRAFQYFNKMDTIASHIFTCTDVNETLKGINGEYKLSKREQADIILMVKIRDMGLFMLMESLMEQHLRTLAEVGMDQNPSPNGSERYIQ